MIDQKRMSVDWEDVRIFLALARHGSLSAAARILAVNHATVARRVHSLEASLGEKLVERRPDGYVLTAAGSKILDAASHMENAAQALGQSRAANLPAGLVRINAPPGLATGFLVSHLAIMAERHPAIDLELATNMRSISLDRHEADIAIRLDRPADGDMIARQIGAVRYGFYGTDDACARIEAGAELRFIGFDEANSFVPDAAWLARRFPRARVVFRASNHYTQALAARSGIGVVLLPHYIGRTDPILRSVDLGDLPPSRDIVLLTRQRDRNVPAIRVVAEEIIRLFAEKRDLFD